ncbi:hypothetical protein BH10PAT1_BH10PAT1_0260 [soil metagenome]
MLEYLFYILFFVLPLIFFPKTSEVFEFNKMVFVYIFTVLIIGFWIIKMIRQKKVIFKHTILDIPIFLFLGSQIISTLVSIDQRTSIFGYYSRFNGGLLSTICFVLLYFAFVSNINKIQVKKILIISLISATIVAIYGILEHFGGSVSCLFVTGHFNDDCWVQDVRTRVFATLGQPNWLAAYLISLIPVTWHLTLTEKENKKKIIWISVSIIFFACILFTGSRSGALGLAAAFIIFWIFNWQKNIKIFIVTSGLFLIAALIFGTPITPSINNLIHHTTKTQTADTSDGGTESGAIREIVWKGAIDIWKANPVFGTGVETFGYSYWQFRPVAHNNTSEWDYLYNKAHNEYLNIAANTGTVGLVTYVIFIGTSIYILRKNSYLLAGFISILITNFFGFSVVVISLFTFIFPAMAIALNNKDKKENPSATLRTADGNQKLYIGVIVLVAGFLILQTGKYWLADLNYNNAQNELTSGEYEASVKDLQIAISYSPNEAIYHNQMARVFTSVSVGLINNNEATDAAKLAPYAISESDQAFSLSPRNMNIRETRMSMYLQLAQLNSKYLESAIDLVKNTKPLSPTDPKLDLVLGKAYANLGQFDNSINAFKDSLKLKPDYAEAKKDLEVIEKIKK